MAVDSSLGQRATHGALVALGLAAAALAGCGPRYQTFTSYTPPASLAGQSCVSDCLQSRQHCRRAGDLEVQQCRIEARQQADGENLRRQALFQIDLQRHYGGQLKDPPPPPELAQPNYGMCTHRAEVHEAQCTEDFDLCYQNCGGTVTYATHCVANCD